MSVYNDDGTVNPEELGRACRRAGGCSPIESSPYVFRGTVLDKRAQQKFAAGWTDEDQIEQNRTNRYWVTNDPGPDAPEGTKAVLYDSESGGDIAYFLDSQLARVVCRILLSPEHDNTVCDYCGILRRLHPQCSGCGYTLCDVRLIGDHARCASPDPEGPPATNNEEDRFWLDDPLQSETPVTAAAGLVDEHAGGIIAYVKDYSTGVALCSELNNRV